MGDDDDSVDVFVTELRRLIITGSARYLARDPAALQVGLRQAMFDLQRVLELTKDVADLAPPSTHHQPTDLLSAPTEAKPMAINVEGMACSIDHLNTHQVSGVREIVLLFQIDAADGTATLGALRDAVSDLWKKGDEQKNDASLRQQLSRLAEMKLIQSISNGNYRITPVGREQLIRSAHLRIGLIQIARPALVASLETMQGWDTATAHH